jgi:hypothetical protein
VSRGCREHIARVLNLTDDFFRPGQEQADEFADSFLAPAVLDRQA